ncbi:MAG TPA: HemK/PrmC family methyltransferase, partial [Solirubrobacterales bacterium]|nr:HemK/PrmC family methyltransferase [Solirubrobacterales bacterium]
PSRVLDAGTGSGAVALALADELPAAEVCATDTSAGALALARLNAERLGLAERIRFLAGTVPDEPFDLTVANLPYVSEGEWLGLEPEIRDWEPREALLAGRDGLAAFREVIPLLRSPAAALEVGAGQAEAVAGMMRAAGYERIETRRDLAGIERVVVGRR